MCSSVSGVNLEGFSESLEGHIDGVEVCGSAVLTCWGTEESRPTGDKSPGLAELWISQET